MHAKANTVSTTEFQSEPIMHIKYEEVRIVRKLAHFQITNRNL